ncbi:hypothetical protein F511_17533 [Dorcoceras hygrometricum]|uniref:Uncharacterized protein n=1 Tax=Dorcoceras hygrometricum TaxID=472368 RepID=A0A2Z7BXP1_9LAMI|nr:hypothetical protein F511_17533 [Dorcoceras hygrometricum]
MSLRVLDRSATLLILIVVLCQFVFTYCDVYFSAVLCAREDFLRILNLKGIDLLTVKIQLDRKEKAYVTGLEAANRVVDYLEEGAFGKIIPLEEDEPHIKTLRLLKSKSQ